MFDSSYPEGIALAAEVLARARFLRKSLEFYWSFANQFNNCGEFLLLIH